MIYNAPIKDMMFLIADWIGMEKLNALPDFADLEREDIEFILEEAGRFASTELLPINRQGDEVGARFEDGKVTTPPGFKEAYDQFTENGWTGIDAEPEHGGQGLPKLLQFQIDEMLAACNTSFKLYCELTHGAYHLLAASAPPEIQETYLPNMVAGRWSGTMCLTEPHCGTDLGLLRTSATDNGDGTYSISGTKIFITSGDHDLTDNILHMVIARLDGAPDGARGISLFMVPRSLVNEDGSVGERNAVTTGSIEHKMGIRASATCVLNFDGATGYLIGEENRGLSAMFKMMNLERITVGIQGLGMADIACQNATAYALERVQSKAPPPRPDESKPADPIICLPDIRRQLLTIRSQVEGGRALAVYTGFHADVMDNSSDPEARAAAADIVALLTPVVKSFLSDLGVRSALSAQQVYGGHGYICEHGMEQLVRDARIAPIYEGTNEVQAQDLVMRKLTARNGALADRFFDRASAFFDAQQGNTGFTRFVDPARTAFELLDQATDWIQARISDDLAAAAGAATDYQRLFALAAIGYFWADMVVSFGDDDSAFHAEKRKLAAFYMDRVLPETAALHRIVTGGAASLAAWGAQDF
jgi:butyryl-CoA dehydrogenase